MHGDHVLFQPFVGVAPRQYIRLFEAAIRKDDDGNAILFDPIDAHMRYSASDILYIDEEDSELNQLSKVLENQGSLFGGQK